MRGMRHISDVRDEVDAAMKRAVQAARQDGNYADPLVTGLIDFVSSIGPVLSLDTAKFVRELQGIESHSRRNGNHARIVKEAIAGGVADSVQGHEACACRSDDGASGG